MTPVNERMFTMEVNEIIKAIRKSSITLVSKETGIDSHRISVLLKFPSEMTKDEKEILNVYFSYPRSTEKTAEELTKNLRENLKSLIRESGIEPDDICKRTGIAVSTIYRIGYNAYTGGFRMGMVTKLSDIFNVPEVDLVFERYDPSWLNRKPIRGEFKPYINLSKAFAKTGITKRALAEKMGIKDNSIVRYFKENTRYPEIETTLRFADAMGIDPRILFERVPSKDDKPVKENSKPIIDSSTTAAKQSSMDINAKNVYRLEPAIKKFYPDAKKIVITFKDGSLLVIRGLINAIEAEFDSATSAVKTVKQTEDFKAFSSDPKYVKILKVVALQNLFEKFGIKYKDLLKEISVIADL